MSRIECISSPFESALATYNCDVPQNFGGVNGVHEKTGDNGFALIGDDTRNVFLVSFFGRPKESLLMGDFVNAKGGDDYIYISGIPKKGSGSVTVSGGLGSDTVDLPGLPDSFEREDNFTVLTWSNRAGSLRAHIGDDVEFVALANNPRKHLLSDLMEGFLTPLTDDQISNVKIDQFIPVKGTENNWFLDEVDEIVEPSSVVFSISPPKVFKNKKAQKIDGFNPERGDILSFNSNDLFNSGAGDFVVVNAKRRLKRASRKGVDFIFYEPKNILYYDANGASKGFGSKQDGGVLAKFVASDDLDLFNITAGNIELF